MSAAQQNRCRLDIQPPGLIMRAVPYGVSYDIEDSAVHVADLRRGICIVSHRPT